MGARRFAYRDGFGSGCILRAPHEHTSDGGLFSALAKLPTQSNVVLNLGAQVALDLYKNKYPDLSQQHYQGWVNPVSAPTIPETIAMTNFADNASKPGAFSSWTYFELKHDFRPLWRYLLNNGKTEFYVANSHQTPIGSPVLDDNAKAMVDVLKERGCGFTSVYAANLVEILSVQCSR